MMKQCLRAFLCLWLLLPLGAKAEGSFTDVVVFGDSLSDTGNLAAFRDINVPLLPPFFPGPQPIGTVGFCNPVDIFILGRRCDDLFFRQSRASNGPVAVEILAERLGFDELQPSLFFLPSAVRPFVGTNYAVAGAEAGGSDLGDLNSQVFGFLADHSFLAPPDALYVVMIGGNDVIAAVKAAVAQLKGEDLEPEQRPKAIIDAAVDAIEANIKSLIGRGARKFLVANSVSIGSVPATRMRAEAEDIPPALLISVATHLTIKFNRQLAQRLDQIRAEQTGSSVKIKEFNLFFIFEGMRLVGRLFDLNTVDACFDTETYQDFSMLMAEREFDPDCAPKQTGDNPRFEAFVYFDDLHPTGRVHAIIGKFLARAARKLIDD
jgi:phospholipase/lecithinase/hemolysin